MYPIEDFHDEMMLYPGLKLHGGHDGHCRCDALVTALFSPLAVVLCYCQMNMERPN